MGVRLVMRKLVPADAADHVHHSTALPGRVVQATAGYSASKLILGIYLSLKSLANASPHYQGTLRRYVSLEANVDHIELSETAGNG